MNQFFKLQATSGKARAGLIQTEHGPIETPVFMPVGTRGSVKTVPQENLEQMDFQIILGNTYHLYLRPGHELVERQGGLHQFISWPRPILTDSGGFQIFSLSDLCSKDEEGVTFRSHLDGSLHEIGPERAMEIQRALGADIVMSFDECPSLPASKEDLAASMELTLRWAQRSKNVPLKPHQHLFGIIQGGLHQDLRQQCMAKLMEIGFDGLALGGLSVGEKNEEMVQFLDDFVVQMPEMMPRYLMGVGTPLDVLNGVRLGLDMFDCVLPTRNARNGQFLTTHGPLSIKKERFKEDQLPPDTDCDCPVCRRYRRSYIRHLYLVGEYLAGQLITHHNLYFYRKMMRRARSAILTNQFDDFYRNFYKDYCSNHWI
ncbi:MAG: tRNA guanosine(34) transglycosylase Tgt [Pseudomonadota bacterium]